MRYQREAKDYLDRHLKIRHTARNAVIAGTVVLLALVGAGHHKWQRTMLDMDQRLALKGLVCRIAHVQGVTHKYIWDRFEVDMGISRRELTRGDYDRAKGILKSTMKPMTQKNG